LPFFRSVATVAAAGENGNAGNVFTYEVTDQNADWLSTYGRTATEWWKPSLGGNQASGSTGEEAIAAAAAFSATSICYDWIDCSDQIRSA